MWGSQATAPPVRAPRATGRPRATAPVGWGVSWGRRWPHFRRVGLQGSELSRLPTLPSLPKGPRLLSDPCPDHLGPRRPPTGREAQRDGRRGQSPRPGSPGAARTWWGRHNPTPSLSTLVSPFSRPFHRQRVRQDFRLQPHKAESFIPVLTKQTNQQTKSQKTANRWLLRNHQEQMSPSIRKQLRRDTGPEKASGWGSPVWAGRGLSSPVGRAAEVCVGCQGGSEPREPLVPAGGVGEACLRNCLP